MSEGDAVERTETPVTVERLLEDLRALGVERGDTLLVHASMSALGWVAGGAPAVVDALQGAVSAAGTLVVPTHSTQLADPIHWENPPVPDDWVPIIRDSSPPYRPEITPTRGMGAVVEAFRDYPGVVRSEHPTVSFAAWGDGAEAITADHSFDRPLGEGSPLARCYERDADVLLLGVGHDRNTSLHLAEHRGDPDPPVSVGGGPVLEEGERVWVEFEELDDAEDFADVGAAFEDARETAVGPVGEGTGRLFAQRDLVDFAADWFGDHR